MHIECTHLIKGPARETSFSQFVQLSGSSWWLCKQRVTNWDKEIFEIPILFLFFGRRSFSSVKFHSAIAQGLARLSSFPPPDMLALCFWRAPVSMLVSPFQGLARSQSVLNEDSLSAGNVDTVSTVEQLSLLGKDWEAAPQTVTQSKHGYWVLSVDLVGSWAGKCSTAVRSLHRDAGRPQKTQYNTFLKCNTFNKDDIHVARCSVTIIKIWSIILHCNYYYEITFF